MGSFTLCFPLKPGMCLTHTPQADACSVALWGFLICRGGGWKLRLVREILQMTVGTVSTFPVGQAATVLPFKVRQGHATLVIKVN